jgi:hypothetical protein
VNLVDRPAMDVSEEEARSRKAGVTNHSGLQAESGLLHRGARSRRFTIAESAIGAGQTEIDGSRIYLMHFPIRGTAEIRVKELAEVKRAAREF